MPVYIRFQRNGMSIPGTMWSSVHTPGWTDFRDSDPEPARGAIPEVGDEVLVGFETSEVPSTSLGSWAKAEGLDVAWNVPSYAPREGRSAILTTEIEFTQPDRLGREIADLRVKLHDVRIVRSEHISRAGGVVPAKRMVIACSRMTQAGMPKSAPDISHQVRARVAKAQVGRYR
ncbi:hypothetical protein [Devosia nitrariae]|uniref:Uncharacterized protein n=1 Tax=Devosia nitrariae TaxID=2071872 RepID=A0ABQ5W6L4_9HYPH|nr:hypothetical protein [Devosia nitrariae]GLQ55560.1 hypothetical protein GCM10010862_28190 [Devosia nitrariae]